MRHQSGFTLIELIAVIVILGILAATAIPKFVDLSASARQSAAQGVAGALGSAAALNHASRVAVTAGLAAPTPPPSTIGTCAAVGLLLDGGLPTKYYISTAAITAGGSATCTVAYDSNNNNAFDSTDTPTATFLAFGD